MLISACMIVKNEAEMLEKTLPNLVEMLDEVIVVDTGSGDETIAVATAMGARVFSFPWTNDFAAARNESLKQARGEWILWIDADEFMTKEDLWKLKSLLKNSRETGQRIPIYECEPFRLSQQTFYYRVKVFRNFQGAHFERPINEQLLDVQGKNIEGPTSALAIYHFGNKLPEKQMKSKKERNVEIFMRAVSENPADVNFRILLADAYYFLKQFASALKEYRAAAGLAKTDAFKIRALVGEAVCLNHLGCKEDAFQKAQAVLELNPDCAEALNILGALYLEKNQTELAINTFKQVIALPIPLFSDLTIKKEQYAFLPHFLLGNAYLLKGSISEAVGAFEKAYQSNATPQLKTKIDRLKNLLKKEVG